MLSTLTLFTLYLLVSLFLSKHIFSLSLYQDPLLLYLVHFALPTLYYCLISSLKARYIIVY
jgi:multisubunit Na+/H+ antiporter MnhC subunit